MQFIRNQEPVHLKIKIILELQKFFPILNKKLFFTKQKKLLNSLYLLYLLLLLDIKDLDEYRVLC